MVARENAITGETLTLGIIFREDDTKLAFDPFSIIQVDILGADGQTVIETISGGSVIRNAIGEYEITTAVVTSPGLILDRWLYRLKDGGVIKSSIERTNVAQAATLPVAVASTIAVPRSSAVILRPLLLTVEFRDDMTGELFDPDEVRQVEIQESDTTLIETITSITRIGVGKYRVQTSAISTPKTILDCWFYTANTNEPERTFIQDTQVFDQAAFGAIPETQVVAELLLADTARSDTEIVLIDSVEKIGILFEDTTGTPINPAKLSLEIETLAGNDVLTDIYLPTLDRSPDPPRIINPSSGRFEFPFGLDNESTDSTKKNKTNQRCDFLFTWRASSICGVDANTTLNVAVADGATVWTSVAEGTPGNFITVEYVDPGASNIALSIDRNGAIITVTLETDGGSAIVSTASEIITAVEADTDVSEIVTIALATGNDGIGIAIAEAVTALTGGVDSSEELVACQNVRIITQRICSLISKLSLQIDKANKFVNANSRDPCFLGYTSGQLFTYLESGMHIINAYQPSGIFSFENYPYNNFEFTLIESSLLAGVMSQDLFAIDTDIPGYNDQGNSFVVQHQPQLVSYLNWLSARLDKLIPMLKLNFVSSGSLHIEAGPNFRLTQLINAAPSGALFRGTFFKS